MKDKLKKYLLPNLPYLFFVYLFDKLCQTVRLAPGLDTSEKLLHIGQGFQTAFASSAPSFHALDICVGILGAVLVRLAVYGRCAAGVQVDRLADSGIFFVWQRKNRMCEKRKRIDFTK